MGGYPHHSQGGLMRFCPSWHLPICPWLCVFGQQFVFEGRIEAFWIPSTWTHWDIPEFRWNVWWKIKNCYEKSCLFMKNNFPRLSLNFSSKIKIFDESHVLGLRNHEFGLKAHDFWSKALKFWFELHDFVIEKSEFLKSRDFSWNLLIFLRNSRFVVETSQCLDQTTCLFINNQDLQWKPMIPA